MSAPESHYLDLAGSEVHVAAWGAADRPPVILWHGLARTGRDFDVLARALADRYRVLAPDTPGRGLSQWAADPDAEYCHARYGEIAVALLDTLGLERVRWVGTSMGGALGLRLAAGPLADRISHLVLNDIGAEVPTAAIERIVAYAGTPPDFARVSELEAFFRTVYAPFGAMTDAEWRLLTETSTRRLPDGRVTPHYDPGIVRQFVAHPEDLEHWDHWRRLTVPTLVLRGVDSDILTPDIAARMAAANLVPTFLEVPGRGHAPPLNVPAQIDPIADFLTT